MKTLAAVLSLALSAVAARAAESGAQPGRGSAAVPQAAASAAAAPEIGRAAPDFTLPSESGKPVKLSAQKGSWVVLEWFNPGCPFVRKHYDTKNMQGLQKRYAAKGVKWYAIASSKAGAQGHLTPQTARKAKKDEDMGVTSILLDPAGRVGRLYGAKTTPHMFVIDPKGILVYMGAIDDKPTPSKDDVAGAANYVDAALTAGMASSPVAVPSTKPYGCSVKY